MHSSRCLYTWPLFSLHTFPVLTRFCFKQHIYPPANCSSNHATDCISRYTRMKRDCSHDILTAHLIQILLDAERDF